MKCACGNNLLIFLGGIFPFVVIVPVEFSRADTVKLRDRPAFEEVDVIGFREGRLLFRGVSGQVLRKSLAEIEWFIRERDPELAQAERLAQANDWPAAAAAYRAAMDQATESWLREWCALRWLVALDRAGQFEKAVIAYIELTRAHPEDASLTPPRHAPQPGAPENALARAALATALQDAAGHVARERLRGALLELVLYEQVQPLPAVLALPDEVLPEWDRELTSSAKPRRSRPRYGLLPERVQHRDLPTLPADSFVLIHAADQLTALEEAPVTDAFVAESAGSLLKIVQAAGLFAQPADQSWVRLLKARAQILLGELPAAEVELSRLIVDTPPPIACSALYHLSRAQDLNGNSKAAERTRRERESRVDCSAPQLSRPAERAAIPKR